MSYDFQAAERARKHPILMTPHYSDRGTITGATTPASMSVQNLLRPQPTDVCRFSSLSGMYFVLDLGLPQTIVYAMLLYTNATVGAQVRWRAANSASDLTTSPGYDSDFVSHWPSQDFNLSTIYARTHHYHRMMLSEDVGAVGSAGPQRFQYWRCDITDSVNPDGYYQAGRLYLSAIHEEGNDDYVPCFWQASGGAAQTGIEIGTSEEIRRIVSEGGQVFSRIRPQQNRMTVPLIAVPRSEASRVAGAIGRLRSVSRDMVVILDPDNAEAIHDQTVYGLLTETMSQSVIGTDPPLWQIAVKMQEMP